MNLNRRWRPAMQGGKERMWASDGFLTDRKEVGRVMY
jgi:hypothetical protein